MQFLACLASFKTQLEAKIRKAVIISTIGRS